MKQFDVVIKGRDLSPCARLMEALTTGHLLSERITWEESGDRVILHITPAGTGEQERLGWQRCRFQPSEMRG